MLKGCDCAGQIYEGYAKKIASNQFEVTDQSPGFKVKLGIKDAGHMKRLAEESQVHFGVNVWSVPEQCLMDGGWSCEVLPN